MNQREEIKGEELKKRLINFRKDLIEINKVTEKYLSEYESKDLHFVDDEKEWKEDFEKSLAKNEYLIEILEAQLKRDFNVDVNAQ